jgi:hypothetical protein
VGASGTSRTPLRKYKRSMTANVRSAGYTATWTTDSVAQLLGKNGTELLECPELGKLSHLQYIVKMLDEIIRIPREILFLW